MKPLAIVTLILSATFVGSSFVTGFDGFDGAQVPIPQDDPPVQPAGWAFSIWLVIYAWLIVSAVWGLIRRADAPDWDRARLPLAVALAVGTPWLAVASVSAIWATVMIFVMAAAAILALLRTPARDRWMLRAPVGLLAGWLTAASFVSLGSTLGGFGVLSPLAAALVCLPLALIAAVAVQALRPAALGYGAAAGWGFLGIAAANGLAEPGITALAVSGIVALGAVAFARRGQDPMQRTRR